MIMFIIKDKFLKAIVMLNLKRGNTGGTWGNAGLARWENG